MFAMFFDFLPVEYFSLKLRSEKNKIFEGKEILIFFSVLILFYKCSIVFRGTTNSEGMSVGHC